MLTRILRHMRWRLRQLQNRIVDRRIAAAGHWIVHKGLRFDTSADFVSPLARREIYFGRYEEQEFSLCHRHLDRENLVVELGSGIGVVSCQLNRILEEPRKHVCVEAVPEVARILVQNRDTNQAKFEVICSAIGYGDEHAIFCTDRDNFCIGGVRKTPFSDSSISVSRTTIAEILNHYQADQLVNLVMDIEGMEYEVIQNETPVLRKQVGVIVMETHPSKALSAAVDTYAGTLRMAGFQLVDKAGDVEVWRNEQLAGAAGTGD